MTAGATALYRSQARRAERARRRSGCGARDEYRKLYLQMLERCRKLELGVIGPKSERLSASDAQLTMSMLGMMLDGAGGARHRPHPRHLRWRHLLRRTSAPSRPVASRCPRSSRASTSRCCRRRCSRRAPTPSCASAKTRPRPSSGGRPRWWSCASASPSSCPRAASAAPRPRCSRQRRRSCRSTRGARRARPARRHHRPTLAGSPAAAPPRAHLRARGPRARAVDDLRLARGAGRAGQAAGRGDVGGRAGRAVPVHGRDGRAGAGARAVPARTLLGGDRAGAARPVRVHGQARRRRRRRAARGIRGLPGRRRARGVRPSVQARDA